MNERLRVFREELQTGLIHREYQATSPSMTADYFGQARRRYMTDPMFKARVDALEAGILHLMEKHDLLPQEDTKQ